MKISLTKLTKLTVPVVFSLCAALVACGGSTQAPKSPADVSSESPGPAEVGKPAPDLSIQTVNGKGAITLSSLSGKVVIVDFWATWCGPCKQSFPKLEELQKKLGDNVVIVGVSVDDDDSGVLEFAKENGATFPIGWDSGHTIASRWNVSTMPTSFIIDGSGVVRYVHAGYHDDEPEKMANEVVEIASGGGGGAAMAKSAPAESGASQGGNSPSGDASAAPKNEPAPAAAAPASDDHDKAPHAKKKAKKSGKGGKKHSKKK